MIKKELKLLNIKRLLSKKTICIILGTTLLVSGTVYYTKINKSKNDDSEIVSREREYKVTRGDITAGISGSGSIKLGTLGHSFSESVVVGEVFVKEGQAVSKGEKLASISEKFLDEKLEVLNGELKTANIALDQAKNNKESTVLTNNQSWKSKTETSKTQYEDQKNQITRNINDVNMKIANIENKINDIRKQLEELASNSEENANVISELKTQEGSLNQEKEGLQGELNDLNKNLSNLEETRKNELTSESNEKTNNEKINNLSYKALDTTIESAQEQVNKVKKEIDKINKLKESPYLYAEADGIVLSIKSNAGATTMVDVPVLEIGENANSYAEISISQNDIINVEEGQKVVLEIGSYEGEKFEGTVKSLNLKPNTQGNTITYSAIVELNEIDYKLLDGMTTTAKFIIKEVNDVLVLSNKAIILKDGKQFVKLRDDGDGSLNEVEIITGFSDGKSSEIISGLNEDDTVVVGG